MDNHGKVEQLLRSYTMMNISLVNMEKELEYINQEDGIRSTDYSAIKIQPTNKISSVTESTALNKLERVTKITKKINKTRLKLEIIDNALTGLNEKERVIVTERYINGKQWWEVAQKVCYSEEQSRNIKRQAMKKLIIGIYGID